MVEMTRPGPISLLAPEFDAFLFASIGEQGNGMLLSVVSALARLDLDPWQEAANLAGLPAKTATRRLSSFIASLPGEPSALRDPETTAARLIKLLPRRALPLPSVETLFSSSKATSSPANRYAIVCVIVMVLAAGAQWVAAYRHMPSGMDGISASASHELASQTVPSGSGQ